MAAAALAGPVIVGGLFNDEGTKRELRLLRVAEQARTASTRRSNLASVRPAVAPLTSGTGGFTGLTLGLSGANF